MLKPIVLRLAGLALFLVVSPPSFSDTVFFPKGTWGPPLGAWSAEQRDAFFEDWFGGQLDAMQELPLEEYLRRDDLATVVRLLVLPSFSPATAVRLHVSGKGGMTFEVKQLDGAGGYAPGNLALARDGEVADDDAQFVLDRLRDLDPIGGKTPSETETTMVVNGRTEVIMCRDGTMFVLEVATPGQFAAIKRHECQLTADDPLELVIERLSRVVNVAFEPDFKAPDPASDLSTGAPAIEFRFDAAPYSMGEDVQ